MAFNTNGLLLTDERCDHLVAAGVQSIAVSIDGMESMLPIRGRSYHEVRERIEALDRAKRRAGSVKPYLGIAFTLFRRNVLELPRVVRDLTRRVDVHSFQVQPLVIHYETLRDENPYSSPVAETALEDAREIAAAAGSRFIIFRSAAPGDERNGGDADSPGQLGQFSERFGCIDPFFSIGIQATGRVLACSGARSPELDVRQTEFPEIWNHEWFRTLRQRLYRREFEGPCKTCSFVHSGASAQVASLRVGVHHSRADRFFRGGYGRRRPRKVADSDYPFLAPRGGGPDAPGRSTA